MVEVDFDERGSSKQKCTIGILLTQVLTKLWNSYYRGFDVKVDHVFLKLAHITPWSDQGECTSCASSQDEITFLDVKLAEVGVQKQPPKFVLTDMERSAPFLVTMSCSSCGCPYYSSQSHCSSSPVAVAMGAQHTNSQWHWVLSRGVVPRRTSCILLLSSSKK